MTTMMHRRQWLRGSAALGLFAATGPLFACQDHAASSLATTPARPIRPPAQGPIPVAFVISAGAVVIDFCGPWEVFQDTTMPGRAAPAFQLYTVAESTAPIRASGGLQIVPDYTFENAPPAKVIVIPAQDAATEATLAWIRARAPTTDVTMSVCTGAFVLAATGLLAGKRATTFHAAFRAFEHQHPEIQLRRGLRFVEDGNLATAGGLSSGIDLALRVVERYFGRAIAEKTAYDLEYQGQGWRDPQSNQAYASVDAPIAAGHVECPVCGMDVDPTAAPSTVYHGKTYYFCSADDQKTFVAAPAKFVHER